MDNEDVEKAARIYCDRRSIDPEAITNTLGVNGVFLREWQLVAVRIRSKLDERVLDESMQEAWMLRISHNVPLGYTAGTYNVAFNAFEPRKDINDPTN